MTANVFVLADPNPETAADLEAYLAGVKPLFESAGARVVTRQKFAAPLAGEGFPKSIAVLEFPDARAAKDFFASAAYKELLPNRDRAFSRIDIFLGEAV